MPREPMVSGGVVGGSLNGSISAAYVFAQTSQGSSVDIPAATSWSPWARIRRASFHAATCSRRTLSRHLMIFRWRFASRSCYSARRVRITLGANGNRSTFHLRQYLGEIVFNAALDMVHPP
ncbi:hypothetical protein Asi03nite_74000 [Actinoplanes siamensis]|uniref:Uncharacterized protein n=1 Tax=Actinoplanes siamensis TaxID=1223317 RepID=A0A919TPJ8_9ACTN|nr:hypothetical protein Asi03nite_74000 [Actinoplanes siamensis]